MNSFSDSSIGYFEIQELLGTGGMGEVYLAKDTRLNRKVAIKFLADKFSENTDRLNRFIQEAKAASALNHPNIITIHEIGEFDGRHYIVTEFIDGQTLRERFRTDDLRLDEIIDIVIQISEALAAAHSAGIIHRDIKPENIMLRNDGYVKVLDFGLAKLLGKNNSAPDLEVTTQNLVKTNPGVVMGTPYYMSPEQARGKDIDEQTDIWSLGVVLYEMLTNQLPFEAKSINEYIAAIFYKDSLPISQFTGECPAELEHILFKTLRKEKTERYQSINDFLTILKSFRRRLDFQAELKRKNKPDISETAETQDFSNDETQKFFHSSDINKDSILLIEFTNLTGDDVFDVTLKMALAVSLEQSPYVDIFPDTKVRETLSLMERSPNEILTRELGRELCLRKGLKAYIAGTISSLGTTYVLTLEAINAKTGETVGRQLEQAESKEQVLKTLGQAASGLREKLGESLSSIEKFDASVEDVTTSSLEALKFFSLGYEQMMRGEHSKAIPFSLRAIEIDPNFAFAYADLAIECSNTGQAKLAAEYATKAFELREKVSEVEKFRITYLYYVFVTGEIDKVIQLLELRKLSNPNEDRLNGSLAFCYTRMGQVEKAIEAARECIRINPQNSTGYSNLAAALLINNSFDEAEKIIKSVHQKNIDRTSFRIYLFWIAVLKDDTEAMAEQIAYLKNQLDEYNAFDLQTQTAAFRGQWRKSQEFSRQSIEVALRNNVRGFAAIFAAEQALRIAFWSSGTELPNANDIRLKSTLKTLTRKTLQLELNSITLPQIILALAFAGQKDEAEKLIKEMKTEYPKNTLINMLWLPTIKGTLKIQDGKPEEAVKELEIVKQYEAAAEFYPQYIRGLSYLSLNEVEKAEMEFQKILDHRGESPLSALYPLAQLGKARVTKDSREYEKFFEMWKDADEDMPALVQAKKEFAEI